MSAHDLSSLVRLDIDLAILHGGHHAGVAMVERVAYRDPLDPSSIRELTNRHGVHGLAALHRRRVVGYAVFRLETSCRRVSLLRLGVLPEHRRKGIAACLVGRIAERLADKHSLASKWNRIVADTRESQDAAHRFLATLGFGSSLVRDHFDHPREDSYRFVYRINGDGCEQPR
jgi:GNAT superfamily N-acetyltransferase